MPLLATYPSSHAALAAERRLRTGGLPVELIPVPRQIRSTCGFCLLVEAEDAREALSLTAPDALWRVMEPLPGTHRKRYEPLP